MNTFRELWRKLARSKKYREHFVGAQAKQAIPFQIRALMKAKDLSQQELAERSGLTQGAISRAANPKYGNLSLNTVVRIAAGFDVAFVGRFVPFSELGRWLDHLNEESVAVPSFEDEDAWLSSAAANMDTVAAQRRLVEVINNQSSRQQGARGRYPRAGDSLNAGQLRFVFGADLCSVPVGGATRNEIFIGSVPTETNSGAASVRIPA